jgi:tRNA modification GTPase
MDDAEQGAILREGMTVVLIGRPNVGKSSLLNRLAGDEVAIVTPIPGTTRDYVKATISVEGVPIHLVDTAGLRDARDEVERLGIERTWRAVETAAAALVISSADEPPTVHEEALAGRLPAGIAVAYVVNKIDLLAEPSGTAQADPACLRVSARTGEGIEALRSWLLHTAGWRPHGEGLFLARERHIRALTEAAQCLLAATIKTQPFELIAEELRLAQVALGAITGEVTADTLLGHIFSRFCIGK